MFNGKAVLITGGTGSFGKKYTERLLKDYDPEKVVIFSRDELKQFEMQKIFNDKRLRYFLGDVRDEKRLDQALRGIDYVIHAAALKQVPAAEYNPSEFVKTNILGAQNVISSSVKNNIKKVIALSTDKAANPINLYGATKLVSDKLFVSANNMHAGEVTKFSAVRYGNVVGSRGSVIPYFRNLMETGETKLPVTHKEMTRFWITLDEGVDFVFKNFNRMQGGEIFVPKIPSTRILDIVKALDPDLTIEEIGIRPGEKLHETMCPKDDSHLTIEFKDYFVLEPTINFARSIDYLKNKIGEQGKRVKTGFEYNSGSNPHFLKVEEIASTLKELNI